MRPRVPIGMRLWVGWWTSLATDPGAKYDKVVTIDAAQMAPRR